MGISGRTDGVCVTVNILSDILFNSINYNISQKLRYNFFLLLWEILLSSNDVNYEFHLE